MIRWIILAKGPDCRGDLLIPDIVCRDSEEIDCREAIKRLKVKGESVRK